MAEHGGNIYRFAEKNNISEREVLDFSASINPIGLPKSVILEIKKIDNSMYHYPDPDAKRLKQAISTHYKIKPDSIVCGNGSTELIYLCPRALKPKNVLIPSPTFSEYERACLLSNSKIKHFKLNKEDNFDLEPQEFINDMKGCDMAFICNPNNPTGRLIELNGLKKIAQAASELKCYLVVDEAFVDFIPEASIIHEVKNNPYLIVLRSMTKFYALSALRLGFGVFHDSVIEKIQSYKEPWTVNYLSQTAGIAALKDEQYREKTFKIIRDGKNLMEEKFKNNAIEYLPSAANFYLLKIKNSQDVISNLNKANIMVRDCSNFRGLDGSYIRIAVKSREDNLRLIGELAKL